MQKSGRWNKYCGLLFENILIFLLIDESDCLSHDRVIQASSSREATIWISQTFSTTEKLLYLPYTPTYANIVICLTYVAAIG